MKFKRIVVLRHGPCDPQGFLTARGRTIIEKVTMLLVARKHIDKMTQVVSSSELRAIKTAQCMVKTANLQKMAISHREFVSDSRICDTEAAIHAISRYSDEETLVVITHLELAAALPPAIGRYFLDIGDFECIGVDRGHGYVIDFEKKTCEYIAS